MSDDAFDLLLTGLFSIALFIWGGHGIVLRKKIDNGTHLILSIGQLIGGLMGFAFLIYWFFNVSFAWNSVMH